MNRTTFVANKPANPDPFFQAIFSSYNSSHSIITLQRTSTAWANLSNTAHFDLFILSKNKV